MKKLPHPRAVRLYEIIGVCPPPSVPLPLTLRPVMEYLTGGEIRGNDASHNSATRLVASSATLSKASSTSTTRASFTATSSPPTSSGKTTAARSRSRTLAYSTYATHSASRLQSTANATRAISSSTTPASNFTRQPCASVFLTLDIVWTRPPA